MWRPGLSGGYDPKVVEAEGELRKELQARTKQSSVPQVFVKGTFVGGCNDGGLGGVATLQRDGRLVPLLQAAGPRLALGSALGFTALEGGGGRNESRL